MPETSYSESQALEEFSQRLSSYENFRSFYEIKPDAINSIIQDELDTDSQIRSFFFNQISITPPREDEAPRTLSLQYNEKTNGPQILNEYFRWTEEMYSQVLVDRASRAVDNAINRNKAKMDAHLRAHQDDIAARIEILQEEDKIRIAELEDRLEAEKQSVVASREERVRILEHAEQIASNLGIEKPTTPRDLGRQTQDRDVIYTEINSRGGLPLYFMGVDALRAEREVIEQNLEEDANTQEIRNIESQLQQLINNRTIETITNRENQTPFIEEYNNLRSQNEILSANIISPSEIDIVSAIHWAYQPNGPESPRSSLIIALSLVFGSMLGVILVFILNFIASIKKYKKQL
ncbi:hypothetical protein QEN58_17805 [Halomonas alkaliantarctica]|uniref:LPS O-antigen subunit length determinant protein (WzzB/FepE family) n=1 Tax=Halomonas alkaliantarctica TaxID=232346 RepID=A0ABY8LL39_9GAMM|nr:hypothetical protein [Halomonas alkaliantarctica]WGI25165.1 hypothetical protein QEN58_17805 [Halomonas alkaliantarctica]